MDRLSHSVVAVLAMVAAYLPYQWMLGYAALRAVWRQVRGVHTWEKTQHIGAHRARQTPGPALAPADALAAHTPALEPEVMQRG